MAIEFPNHSRSHDAARHAVQFWGYDTIVEVLFRITEGALSRINAGPTQDSASFLSAFDRHRDRIFKVASEVYSRGRRGTYELVASDF